MPQASIHYKTALSFHPTHGPSLRRLGALLLAEGYEREVRVQSATRASHAAPSTTTDFVFPSPHLCISLWHAQGLHYLNRAVTSFVLAARASLAHLPTPTPRDNSTSSSRYS